MNIPARRLPIGGRRVDALELVTDACEIAAERDYVGRLRRMLARNGIVHAVAARDNEALFAWLVDGFVYQGVSDQAARNYLARWGNVGFRDIEAALARDIKLVKFFPAEAAGGLAFLEAVAAPYRDVSFMPTGGITPANLPDYLGRPFVAACGGSWIATEKAINDKRFDAVAAAAATAAAQVARVRCTSETSPSETSPSETRSA